MTVSGSRPSVSIRNEGKSFGRMKTNSHTRKKKETYPFFLLAAAWVDPGRNALQSAEQRC